MPPTNPNSIYKRMTCKQGLDVSSNNQFRASIKVGDARVAARVAAANAARVATPAANAARVAAANNRANAAAANAATPAKHPYELTIKNYKEKKPPLMLSLAINKRKMTAKKTPNTGGKRRRITRPRRRHQ